MTHENIEIPGLGTFSPSFWESGQLACFQQLIAFGNSAPKLVVYPNGTKPPSLETQQELRDRFQRFLAQVEQSLTNLPTRLREECRLYEIPCDHLSDRQMLDELSWTNINLDPSGTIECYAKLPTLTTNYDISFAFDRQMRLYRVQFDG